MVAALSPVFTVHEAMIVSGVNDADNFDSQSSAVRIAEYMFEDDFSTCMDKNRGGIDNDFKTFSSLTVAQGKICLLPGVKKHIKAFTQWVKDQIRLGRDPSLAVFPVAETAIIIRHSTTQSMFVRKSSRMSDAVKPVMFTIEVKWTDRVPSFPNYLQTIPGRDGIPLSYIIRILDAPDPTLNPDFIDDYITMAPLVGESFNIDMAEVQTLLIKYIVGNTTSEAKI